jgi:endoglucanase
MQSAGKSVCRIPHHMSNLQRISIALIIMAMLLPTSSFASSPTLIVSTPDVWWPANSAQITGIQPFKAVMSGASLENYSMYWQVDNGQWNRMENSYQEYPHKEAIVNLDGWTWKDSRGYDITFIVVSSRGYVLGKKTVSISVGAEHPKVIAPVITPIAAPTPIPAIIPSSGNPLAGKKLYVNPYNDPSNWVATNRSIRSADTVLMGKIAQQPEVNWFGNWNSDVESDVHNTVTTIGKAGALPVFAVYNIPQRDCGGYSAGGSGSPEAYKSWIRSVARGIGTTKVAVLVEPDALVGMECLSQADQQARMALIKDAVQVLKATGASVYIDAGHPAWKSASDMAARLKQAGIDQADGFSLNVSNFRTTTENITYGTQISQLTGGKHFVIDTGRNGNGPASDNQWCNPFGRALGNKPTTSTGQALVDAYLWVRGPSGSDGQCNGGPSAGSFWPDYGLDLAKNTQW